jgi:hypothetical protein
MNIILSTDTEQGTVLELERDGILERCFCPHASAWADGSPKRCGGWCPQFGEVEVFQRQGYEYPNHTAGIRICQGRVLMGFIFDKRKK